MIKNKLSLPQIFKKLSLKELIRKITLKYSMGSLFLLIIFSIVVSLFFSEKSQEQFLNKNFENNSTFLTQVLGESIEEATTGNNFSFLEGFLKILMTKHPDIVYIMILSSDGDIMLSSVQSLISKDKEQLKTFIKKWSNKSNSLKLIKNQNLYIKNILLNERNEIDEEIQIEKQNYPKLNKMNDLETTLQKEISLNNEFENSVVMLKNLYDQQKKYENSKNTIKLNSINKKIETLETSISNTQAVLSEVKFIKQLYEKYFFDGFICKFPNSNMYG